MGTFWEVLETREDNRVAEFGPFDTLEAAIVFLKVGQMPWFDQTLSKITLQKQTKDKD
jgi:hypothetical protein